MHSMDNCHVSTLLALIWKAGVTAIANPLINIVIQRCCGMIPVREMLATGISMASRPRIPSLHFLDFSQPTALSHFLRRS